MTTLCMHNCAVMHYTACSVSFSRTWADTLNILIYNALSDGNVLVQLAHLRLGNILECLKEGIVQEEASFCLM